MGLFSPWVVYALATVTSASVFEPRAASPLIEQTCADKQQKGYTCRIKGTLTSSDANTLGNPTDLTEHGCRNACRLNSKCISFGWDTAAETCKLYSKQLRTMGFKASPASSVVYANRRHCYTCSACTNTLPGAQWAFYDYDIGGTDGRYSSFEPSDLNTHTPSYTGVTTQMGNIQGGSDPSPIYGSSDPMSHTFMALNHHGYIFAPATGNYTMTVKHADDVVLVWVGKLALTGWNRANAVIDAYYDNVAFNDPNTWQTYSFPLAAGEYMPYRVIYANAQGNYYFDIDITGPDGTLMMGEKSQSNANAVQSSCDGTAGPAMSFAY